MAEDDGVAEAFQLGDQAAGVRGVVTPGQPVGASSALGSSRSSSTPRQDAVRFSHLVPRSSEVNTRAAAAIALMRCGQTVTR
ncbi:hypothetical protein, partial [Blastococcus mobilis]|uniref:hypothetical protein n=1 Tax=Blastococcus mobilis TaxID=1938746 RepID=UPI001C3C7D40